MTISLLFLVLSLFGMVSLLIFSKVATSSDEPASVVCDVDMGYVLLMDIKKSTGPFFEILRGWARRVNRRFLRTKRRITKSIIESSKIRGREKTAQRSYFNSVVKQETMVSNSGTKIS